GFDALDRQVDADAVGEQHHAADDFLHAAVVGRRAGQDRIDLDAADVEAVQMDQRGKARAEIIEAQLDAEGTQILQHAADVIDVAHQYRFGDFGGDARGFETAALQGVANDF